MTTIYKRAPDIVRVAMVLKRKCPKEIDPLGSSKLLNRNFRSSFPEVLSIVVKMTAFDAEISRAIHLGLLLNIIAPHAHWFFCAGTSGVYVRVRLEERPKQIVCDLAILEQ